MMMLFSCKLRKAKGLCFSLILSLLTSSLFSDVISPFGEIKFDIQSNGQSEMILNGEGLGIGVSPSANLHVNGNAIIPQKIFIGNNSGSSNLNIHGTLGYVTKVVSSNTTLGDDAMVLVDTSSANVKLTLPNADLHEGKIIQVKHILGDSEVTIFSEDQIDGDKNVISFPYSSTEKHQASFIAASGNWFILTKSDGANFSNEGIQISAGSDSNSVSGNIQRGPGSGTSAFGGTDWQLINNGAGDSTSKGILRFDISSLPFIPAHAEINLTVSEIDSAIAGDDQTISIYGLTDETLDSWSTAGVDWDNAIGNDTSSASSANLAIAELLGTATFDYSGSGDFPARPGSTISFSSSNLINFLRDDTNDLVTFILGRTGTNSDDHVLFAGDTHSVYDAANLKVSASPLPTVLSTSGTVVAAGLDGGSKTHSLFFDAGSTADKLIVEISSEKSGGEVLVSYNDEMMTEVVDNGTVHIFYLDNPYTGGSANLFIDMTAVGVINGMGLAVISVSGLSPGVESIETISSSDNITVQTPNNNSFVVVGSRWNVGGSMRVTEPLTMIYGQNIGSSLGTAGYHIKIGAGSMTYYLTGANDQYGAAVFSCSVAP